MILRFALRLLFCILLFSRFTIASEPTPEQLEFFEARIRPVLVEQCYSCHNSTKEAAGSLALDYREGLLKGGDRGKIVLPGRPKQSQLLAILRHEVADLKMPQDGAKFDAEVVSDFERWITMGAPDPRDKPPTEMELEKATSWETTFAKRKKWWSFQPVRQPNIPQMADNHWSAHPIDRFLLSAMRVKGLTPSKDADKRTLLRRVSFVLTGLPPTQQAIEEFLSDDSETAYEALVDRLLESPRFGERWARHWMDLVRYCESHGSQGDPQLANAYRYRDYLIRAFNNDVPYNQLVREHLAGDLLAKPRWNKVDRFSESAIGPAHLRMVELGFVPVDALEDQVKVVDNLIDVYSKAFLGLTASCARCHNHKFDPISQKDFYALYGIFASGRPGQVLIDSPELQNKNRDELTALKKEIRDGLAISWLEAAAAIKEKLRAEAGRKERVGDLRMQLEQSTKQIAMIEGPARVKVLANSKPNTKASKSKPASLPTPFARWSFEGDTQDSMGSHHGQLMGGAVVKNGRLVMNGKTSYMITSPLKHDIREKTLEAWVALAHLNQRGIGVIGLDNPPDKAFDSIVFGEKKPGHWMAGSDFFKRTTAPGGPKETSPPGQLIHMVIVYSKDNSITIYRNGQRYGKSYKMGSLYRFQEGTSRFLFGQRLTGVNPPLAGEIEEARAYTHALTAGEVIASFEAGPRGVSREQILAVLEPEQQKALLNLHALREELKTELKLLDPLAGGKVDPWAKSFEDAHGNKANPLHAWVALEGKATTELKTQWDKLAQHWTGVFKSRHDFNKKHFTKAWDLSGEDSRQWFGHGSAFLGRQVQSIGAGEFIIEPTGDRVTKGILDSGIFSNLITDRHSGILSSPRFVVKSNSISVRAFGKNARVRLVIENYPLGNGGIYPAATLNHDNFTWHVLNTKYRVGQHAHLEFVTNETERASFGAAQILTSNAVQKPQSTSEPISLLLQGDAPASMDALAKRLSDRLIQAINAWKSQTLSDEELAYLDFFVRQGLVPTKQEALPGDLSKRIERYRQLEQQIPVPRRAPGLLETKPFDQPLFERGQHTKPAESVARRGLSLFGDKPFEGPFSGRLKLAEQTASATNPLTSRVMVNRLWHYVFGRGIVATVDNFGHLGQRPSHPELLDHLASRFVRDGWSVKRMLKFLVTSRAFRQSSNASDEALQQDPNNRLLSHMTVKRLDADAIRDSMLMASGQLNFKMFGPGIDVYYTNKSEGGGAKGPLDGARRRSVYLRIRRNAHNPFLEAFDAPKPTSTRGRRDITNVPAQSLTMLNDPFVIDQAAKWSRDIVAGNLNPEGRVRMMYRRGFARDPTAAELQTTLKFVADLHEEHIHAQGGKPDEAARQLLVWQDVAHAMFCLKEFIYVE